MQLSDPLERVSSMIEDRRDRAERRPVEGTSIRLGALLVFLVLIALMVLTAGPSVGA